MASSFVSFVCIVLAYHLIAALSNFDDWRKDHHTYCLIGLIVELGVSSWALVLLYLLMTP